MPAQHSPRLISLKARQLPPTADAPGQHDDLANLIRELVAELDAIRADLLRSSL